MRSLERNKRPMYYAQLTGTEPILDEYGNATGEVRKIYSDRVLAYYNISASSGEESQLVFGGFYQYSRVLTTSDMTCPINEHSAIWFNATSDTIHNYEVVKVADGITSISIALREVTQT